MDLTSHCNLKWSSHQQQKERQEIQTKGDGLFPQATKLRKMIFSAFLAKTCGHFPRSEIGSLYKNGHCGDWSNILHSFWCHLGEHVFEAPANPVDKKETIGDEVR